MPPDVPRAPDVTAAGAVPPPPDIPAPAPDRSPNPADPGTPAATQSTAEATEAPLPRKPYPGFVQAVVLVVVLIALQLAVGLAIFYGGKYILPDITVSDASVLGIGTLVTSALVLVWAVRRTGLPRREALPFAAVPVRLYAPLAIGMVGLGIVNTELLNLVNAVLPMPGALIRMFQSMSSGGLATVLAFILIAPLMEELLFRGIILGGFLRRYRPGTAVVVSAVLFGLVHLNPYQFVSALITGLLLGWLFLRTGSLWPCFVGHALYNGYLLIVHGKLLIALNGGLAPQTMQFQPLWLDLTGLALAAVAVVALHTMVSPKIAPGP
jgi:membrane protease YdiL (CAAX protease family)